VPVVGVVSSAILLGEEITVALSIGLVLVVIGVAINLLTDKNKEEIGPPVVEGSVS
jgi:drug/metabolite transporter (DMT)-like permease